MNFRFETPASDVVVVELALVPTVFLGLVEANMTRRWVLRAVAALALQAFAAMQSGPVAAQAPTSPESPLLKFRGLVALCGRSDPASTAACTGYITGFVHGSQAMQEEAVIEAVAIQVARGAVPPTDKAIDTASAKLRKQSKLFCIRSNWTAGYVQAVVGQYAREHVDALDDMSADHMLKILAKAFPCDPAK